MADIVIGIAIVSAFGFAILVRAAYTKAPTCVCNRPDCGGGCWNTEKKNGK